MDHDGCVRVWDVLVYTDASAQVLSEASEKVVEFAPSGILAVPLGNEISLYAPGTWIKVWLG